MVLLFCILVGSDLQDNIFMITQRVFICRTLQHISKISSTFIICRHLYIPTMLLVSDNVINVVSEGTSWTHMAGFLPIISSDFISSVCLASNLLCLRQCLWQSQISIDNPFNILNMALKLCMKQNIKTVFILCASDEEVLTDSAKAAVHCLLNLIRLSINREYKKIVKMIL